VRYAEHLAALCQTQMFVGANQTLLLLLQVSASPQEEVDARRLMFAHATLALAVYLPALIKSRSYLNYDSMSSFPYFITNNTVVTELSIEFRPPKKQLG
jgi:hypothetical protein